MGERSVRIKTKFKIIGDQCVNFKISDVLFRFRATMRRKWLV